MLSSLIVYSNKRVGNVISYARLVTCAHESAGKRSTGRNAKIGNAHLRWAFGEAAQAWHQKLVSRYGKAKALSVIAQRLGRTVYTMLKRRTAAGFRGYDWAHAALLF